ncbi:HNH endonuclease family protein [Streptomyces olivoreticuli]
MNPRTTRTALAAVLLAAALAGCSSAGEKGRTADEDKGGPGTARAALAELPVKKAASKSGYDREAKFGPAWSDSTSAPGSGNSCDTRNDILARDLTDKKFKSGSKCVIDAGTLADPYTGGKIRFERGRKTSSAVQIDHIVALSNAWQTGAQKLPQARREALANDPLNLVSADGPANMGKGDKDASAWLPANKGFRCTYVARQVAVKKAYGLWVTQEERDAIGKVLEGCPGEALPGGDAKGVALR